MKKIMKQFPILVVIAVVVSILQFVIWNASNLLHILDKNYQSNQRYTLENMESANWTEEGSFLKSQVDPILVVPGLGTKIETIKIEVAASPEIPYVEVFYVNEQHPVYGEVVLHEEVQEGSVTVDIKDYVKDLRLDLGDEAGVVLESVILTVNPVVWNFNPSIVVAAVLVYLMGKFLFWIQRSPKYGLESEGGGTV